MRILKTSRRQYAVYWPPAAVDSYSKITYGTPVEMLVRWTDRSQDEAGPRGNSFVSRAQVDFGDEYDVKVGGAFWKGRLAQVPTDRLTDPLHGSFGAYEVKDVRRIPTIKATQEYCYAVL